MPTREALSGLSEALSVTVMLAVRVPVVVGLNVTVMVQAALIPNVLGQLFV